MNWYPMSDQDLKAPFRQCAKCRCCPGGDGRSQRCATMNCCYHIDCNLPNKPYGTCAFKPLACNCNACSM
ncbi:hypothetical protein FRX31_028036 [Thalictrum thalictroides]|uniref:DUF7866 domain-containing protein n=1 Tax=Thalictrum thalictroides TaxID=46969 RepID=A0A7J6VCA1_THATH|nr:hypothetical protein FRX31_028036 [Thalictrum thalictroides]